MTLAARLSAIDDRIADAARRAGRDPGDITRIVVTKFHPAQLVRDLRALGARERRADEAARRIAALRKEHARKRTFLARLRKQGLG